MVKNFEVLRLLRGPYFYAGLAIALAYYIADALVMTVLTGEGDFWRNLISPEAHAIWMRSSIAILAMVLGILIQFGVFKRRQSENQYRNLIENTDVIAWELDLPSFCFTYVSSHAQKMLGYPVEEWKRKNFWVDHLHPEDKDHVIEFCEQATAAGENHDFEYRMRKADGDYIWLRDIVTVNTGPDGQPTSLSGFLVDISGRKESEKRLRIINQFASDLLRLDSGEELIWHVARKVVGELGFVECVIYVLNEDKGVLVQSAAFGPKSRNRHSIENPIEIPLGEGITGHVAQSKKGEIIGDTSKDPRYVRDIDHMLSEICVPLVHEGRVLGVIDGEHPDKDHFTPAHLDLLNTIAAMLATKLAQCDVLRKLKRGEEEMLNAQSIAHFGAWTFDYATGIAKWSEESFRIFDQDPASFVPTYDSFMECVHPDDREKVRHALNQTLETGVPYNLDHRIILPDGSVHFVNERGQVARDNSGRPVSMAGTVLDITERKKAEEALGRALVDAEQANQAKSEFLATMSHDLRTPLNAIMGFSEMMTRQIFGQLGSEKYQEYAEDIHSSSGYLLHLINDILDLSTIEAGEHALLKQDLSLDDVAGDCLSLVQKMASDKGVVCRTDISEKLPPIYADRRALKQILINILSNAVKFTPVGGTVALRAEVVEGWHVIEVIDTGQGIPPEAQKHITVPFFRVNNDAYTAHEGTGLGLAIVKSLVSLHQGELAISSVVGEGTVVTVRLPGRDIAGNPSG